MGHDKQVCLPEQDKGAQHNQHRRFGVSGTSQCAGKNLIESAQDIEVGHVMKKHSTVLDYFRLTVEERNNRSGENQNRDH